MVLPDVGRWFELAPPPVRWSAAVTVAAAVHQRRVTVVVKCKSMRAAVCEEAGKMVRKQAEGVCEDRK